MTQASSVPIQCPRCAAQMLPVARFGVEIDQCTGCGGIFLDRGELEQLAAAEANFYAGQPGSPPQRPAMPAAPAEGDRSRGGFLTGLFAPGHGQYSGGHHGGRRGGHH
ncbi:zf-TFIIB domain-containing protein [Mycolicibacterium llatzerense]|nr:zf-TFIIB domain-containing protein [Mycolicibacterium llatzerense]